MTIALAGLLWRRIKLCTINKRERGEKERERVGERERKREGGRGRKRERERERGRDNTPSSRNNTPLRTATAVQAALL